MTDLAKLTADIAELKALIVAQQTTPAPVPVDEQPAVDALDTEVVSIIALVKPAPVPVT